MLTEILLFFIYFAFGISWLAYAPLLTEVESAYRVTHAQGGLLISSVSLAKAFVPMLAGLLAARIGLRRAILVGAALAATALLAPLTPTFSTLLAARFVFGIGGAIVVTLMGALVMELFPRERLPMVNGLNNVAVNAGISAALFLTVPVSAQLGWRTTLLVFGCTSALLAVLWGLHISRHTDTRLEKKTASGLRLQDILRKKETWLIALAFTGPLSLYLALNTWLPHHYIQAFGLTKADASRLTGLFNLVGIPTAVLGGWLTARLGLRRPLIIAAGLAMPPAALGLCFSPDQTVRVIAAVLLGMSFFLYVSPLFTIPMELPGMTPAGVAMLNGVVFSVAYMVSFASPVLVGALRDGLGSYVPGLMVFALLSATLAVAGYLLPETGRLSGLVRKERAA